MLRTLLLLFPVAAQASEAASPGVSSGTYLQAGFALILIVGLLAATAWMARKVSGGKGFGQAGLKVIGGVALGPRERIVLVEVGDDWLVIGIVPGQIRTLHRLAKGSLPEGALPAGADKPFAQWLQGIANRQHHD
ncbi:MAG TPA: flagellar biosynthetic protein FliO [Azonexus sp.]|nr:flagellar biosynthetic protein FliO [Azonexus sp.]